MSGNAVTATVIFGVAMVATVALGVWSGRGREKSLDEWSISGRGLGVLFVVLFMAGESYTSFSFLGTAGWSFSFGVPILYLVGYLSAGLLVAYLVAPLLWTYASRHKLNCISDIAEHRFRSKPLGILVAVIATIFLVPYIQVQIQGMGAVVNAMTYGSVDLKVAGVISFVVAEAFILVSGLRGSAWVSVLKDGLVILAVVFLAVWVPVHYFDGIGDLLNRVVTEKPQWLTFPGHGQQTYSGLWFVTTVVLNSITIVIFPTTVSGYLSARDANTLRRNSIILPWYQLLLLIPMMIGFAALFVLPNLKNSDLALFGIVTDSLPAWVVALIGVAGALSAIVPMSVFMLAIGTMWGRTVLGGLAKQGRTEAQAGRLQRQLAQAVCLVAGLLALLGSLFVPSALVNLSVLSYEGLAQIVPVVLLGLYWRRMSTPAATAGLLVGSAVMVVLHVSGHDPLLGVNGGLWALAVNLVVVVAVSLVRPDPRAVTTPRVSTATASA